MKQIVLLLSAVCLAQSLQALTRPLTPELPKCPSVVECEEEDVREMQLSCGHWVTRLQLDDWLFAGVDECPGCHGALKKGTVLLAAVFRNDRDVMKGWLSAHSVTLDELFCMRDLAGNSIVMMAVKYAHESTVEALLELLGNYFGQDARYYSLLSMPNNEDMTPLDVAEQQGDENKKAHLNRVGLVMSMDDDDDDESSE